MELTKEYFDKQLKGLVKNSDLKSFATKDDLKGLATKDDLLELATKNDLRSVRDDIDELKSWSGELTNAPMRTRGRWRATCES